MSDNNTDREALAKVISEAENLTDDEGAWALPEDIADAILAAGFRRQPEAVTDEKVKAIVRHMYLDHRQVVDPERSSDHFVVWGCSCGGWKGGDFNVHRLAAALIAASQTGGQS